MRLRPLAIALGVGLFAALFVNALGAFAQERNGGRGRGFPDWLYAWSGYAFYVLAAMLIGVAFVAAVRRLRRRR